MGEMCVRVTVFTPTYNRAYSLPRLYDSLKRQTFNDFEWVIVDDGSTDNTTEVVDSFFAEKPFFEIKYRRTENGGKHRAINRGMDMVSGELFFLVDSDDWLREDALECIDRTEKSIPTEQKNKFCGVYGLRVHTDGSIIGSTITEETRDLTYFERNQNGISGDKAECYYSYLMRKYPFPEYDGEKFCTECLVWDQIAAEGLKIRFFNQGIYFCEYLEDGLTKSGNMLYAKNPKQYGVYVHNNYVYKKQDRFHATIKIYEYYLYERKRLSYYEIVKNLDLSVFTVSYSIVLQWSVDKLRWLFNSRRTVYNTVMLDIKNAEEKQK